MPIGRIGDDLVVNTTTASDQSYPSIAVLPDGRIFVTWQSWNGSDYDIRGRVYDADGTAIGNDFLVSTTKTDDQERPKTTALPDGRLA